MSMEVKVLKRGNTTYKLVKGYTNTIIFEREIFDKEENCYHLRESLSINIKTHEVYCNRTGDKSMGERRYMNLVIRIENLFEISSLLDII